MGRARYHVVLYSHCDEGWGYYWGPTMRHIRMADTLVVLSAINLLRNCGEFKWVLDNYVTLHKFWRDFPELREALRRASGEGRLEIAGGLLAVPDMLVDGESLIRSVALGRDLIEGRLGLRVRRDVLMAADASCHHAQLPQILSKLGVRYYKLCRPAEGALSAKGVPVDFVWEGLDGSRVVCNRVFYCSAPLDPREALGSLPRREALDRLASELERAADSAYGPGREGPRLVVVGGDWALFHPALCDVVRHWRESRGVDAEVSTLSEYFGELRPERLRVVRGSLDPVGWAAVYGLAAGLSARRLLRAVRRLLDAEKLCSMAHALGRRYPERAFRRWWLAVCANWHHDSAYAYLSDVDFRAQGALLRGVYASSTRTMLAAARYVASRVDTSELEGRPVVVFNTLPWPRRDLVVLSLRTKSGEGVSVLDSEGREVPCQVLGARDEEGAVRLRLAFLADVPGMGYRAYQLVPGGGEGGGRASGDAVRNEFLELRVEGGCVASLVERRSGLRLISEGAGPGNDLVVEEVRHGWAALSVTEVGRAWRSSEAELDGGVALDGELVTELRYRGAVAGARVSKAVAVYHHKPLVEFRTAIEERREGRRHRAAFPLSFEGELTRSIPFGSERFDPESEPYVGGERSNGLLPGVFWASEWADYSCPRGGLTLAHRWGLGYQAEGRRLSLILLSTVERGALGRFAYPHLVGVGRHRFTYAAVPHPGGWREGKAYRVVAEWLSPLVAVPCGRHWGPLPAEMSVLELRSEPSSAAVSAAFVWGGHLHLRVYDAEGAGCEVSLRVLGREAALCEVDMECREVLSGPSESVRLRPHEVKTLRVL